MLDAQSAADETARKPEPLSAQLINWFICELIIDSRAKLVEGGAGGETHIDLADVFVDLPASVWKDANKCHDTTEIVRLICQDNRPADMSTGTSPSKEDVDIREISRLLIVGGPGSGKSTVTTMISQLLRLQQINNTPHIISPQILQRAQAIKSSLEKLQSRLNISSRNLSIPIRINLPEFSRWMARHESLDSEQPIWTFLTNQAIDRTSLCEPPFDINPTQLQIELSATRPVLWIFDGLDEVPRSAGRGAIIRTIHEIANLGSNHHIIVTTRPQGYEGEFSELDSAFMNAMAPKLALDYGKRLLTAWRGNEDPQLKATLDTLDNEFQKAEIQSLVRSPLHATMATLLVAEQGALPNARYMLFDHYFDTIFRRELGKSSEHNIRIEEKAILKKLHARAGLVLHTRSQERTGAHPTLSLRELRSILSALLEEEGRSPNSARGVAERMLGFAANRLVLLIRVTDGGYSFGIRSLQEFFAGVAITEGEAPEIKLRIAAIALNPHWTNVLGLIVSGIAVPGASAEARKSALEYTRDTCLSMNRGELGGRAAADNFLGSRLAISILKETEQYGNPWLHDPLWSIVFEAAKSPLQAVATWHSSYPDDSSSAMLWEDPLEIHIRIGILATDWLGNDQDKWRQLLLDTAEEMLGQGSTKPLSAWFLLLMPLHRDLSAARELASRYPPLNRDIALAIFENAYNWTANTGSSWIADFVSSRPDWFPPGRLCRGRAHNGYSNDKPDDKSLIYIGRSLERANTHGEDIFVSIAKGMEYRISTLSAGQNAWTDALTLSGVESAEWKAWNAYAAFHAAPSKETLARALEAAAAPGAWDDWPWISYFLSWPLVVSLRYADSPQEALRVAEAADRGLLGDLNDWKKAEERWKNSPAPTHDDIKLWLSAKELPWNMDIAERGYALTQHFVQRGLSHAVDTTPEIRWVCEFLRSLEFYPKRVGPWLHHLFRYAEIFHSAESNSLAFRNFLDLNLVKSAPQEPDNEAYSVFFSIDLLLPDLDGPLKEEWFQLLDARGREGLNITSGLPASERSPHLHIILDRLVDRLATHSHQWGLIDALWGIAAVVPSASLQRLKIPSWPTNAPMRFQVSAIALSLLAPNDDVVRDASRLIRELAASDDLDLRRELAYAISRRSELDSRIDDVLFSVLESVEKDDENLRVDVLSSIFRRFKSSARPVFLTEVDWKRHSFSLPYLSGQPPYLRTTKIVDIVELSNVRLFDTTPTVTSPFTATDSDQGQWIVLIGENGVGKTTLLRAIGLALAESTVATRLIDENLPILRTGIEARISIRLDSGLIETRIQKDTRTESVTTNIANGVVLPWVVGYGVRRGNARGEKDRTSEWGPTGELHTLFDRPAALINAVDWIQDLDRRVLNERRHTIGQPEFGLLPHATAWLAVERALKALLGISEVVPADRHVFVVHPQFGRVRLDALSDGYLATVGWVIDLIARWMQRQEDLHEFVGGDLLKQIAGVVLVDEIDLHLHPMWQMRIIEDVRRLFPRLSFVVTTHSPLTLHGARNGEIYIMRRIDDGRIELEQRDIRPGHDVDRVLLEQFGLIYTFDQETRNLLILHRRLLEEGARSDDPDRNRIEKQLEERLGRIGQTLIGERDVRYDNSPWTAEQRSLLEPYRKG
jgi:energy-coupling factor transporter ATP-binding protein EcfA2